MSKKKGDASGQVSGGGEHVERLQELVDVWEAVPDSDERYIAAAKAAIAALSAQHPMGVGSEATRPAVDEARLRRLVAIWRMPEDDNGEEETEFDKGCEQTYRECADVLECLLTPQQPAACPKCNGTGEADSGGIMPWGAPAMIPCDCQQPEKGETP